MSFLELKVAGTLEVLAGWAESKPKRMSLCSFTLIGAELCRKNRGKSAKQQPIKLTRIAYAFLIEHFDPYIKPGLFRNFY